MRQFTSIACFFIVFGMNASFRLSGQPNPFERDKALYQKAPYQGKDRTLYKMQFDSTDTFDVLHYGFDLTFPLESSAFSGSVTLTCRAMDGLSDLDLQMGELTIDAIYVRGLPVAYKQHWETLSLSLPLAISINDTFSLKIGYHGEPEDEGFYLQERCAYTMAEPEEARCWFPGHDVPWDKATADLFITVPAGVEVASIGLLKSRALSGDGAWETFHWATAYPVATYLICITMSDEYLTWSDWYTGAEGRSIEMPYYIFPEDSDKAKIDVANMAAAMSFYEERFGPYPFEKYGTATVTSAWFGGMEHQTMTTVVQRWFNGARSYESGFVHELAHMWWGDAVTLSDWPEIWLNEGFATYSELLFRENFYGRARFLEQLLSNKNVYIKQTESFDFPIYDPPRESLFNWGITYIKGSWVLHMLRHLVGEEAFMNILPAYYEMYKYQNASIAEFQAVCEQESGMALDWFFDQWIYRTGYMRLTYDWNQWRTSGNRMTVQLQVEQEAPLFTMPVDIRLQGVSGDLDTTVWIAGDSHQWSWTVPDSVRELRIDPDYWVLLTDTLTPGLLQPPEAAPTVRLFPPAPNPFGNRTAISYQLPAGRETWSVSVDVINLKGQRVRRLARIEKPPGIHRLFWDGRDETGRALASGVYVMRLEAGGRCSERKVVLMH
ncbi:hypothetical protein JW948_05015 [bacterium]|nr:hypothetical protein [bacterium]